MNLLTLIAASWLSAAEAPVPTVAPIESRPLLMAQADRPPRRNAQRPPRKDPQQLATEIGLDATQSDQFVAILNEQRSKHEALRGQGQEQREASRDAHRSIDEETFVRLSTVLNTEQLARFHANRPQRPEKRRGRGNREQGGQS